MSAWHSHVPSRKLLGRPEAILRLTGLQLLWPPHQRLRTTAARLQRRAGQHQVPGVHLMQQQQHGSHVRTVDRLQRRHQGRRGSGDDETSAGPRPLH
eukprot:478630-Hanusia_phi.AAC.1